MEEVRGPNKVEAGVMPSRRLDRFLNRSIAQWPISIKKWPKAMRLNVRDDKDKKND